MGATASVPVAGGTVLVSIVDTQKVHPLKLRLKLKIVDDKGQSQNYVMLVSVDDPTTLTMEYLLRCAEQLYAARTGVTTTLTELLTDDNFQLPSQEPLGDYLRDSDKLIARATKAAQPVAAASAASKPLQPAATTVATTATQQPTPSAASVIAVPEFFCSYCWKNSKNAEEQNEIEGAVGVTDPREIQAELKTAGLYGWLDKEQLGKAGLFDQLCSALLSARAVVPFISDEYAKSENCNMELLYSAKTLHLPIIPVVVGTGMDWLKTKIGMVLAGQLWIDMRDPDNIENALKQLKDRLNQTVGANVDEATYAKLANVADPNAPEVDDGFEVLCHYNDVSNLNFDSEFSQEIVYFRKTGKPTEGAPASLLSDYWWPVTIVDVDEDQVRVKYTAYEDWPEEFCWFNKNMLRPVQYATRNLDHKTLKGKRVEAKLHQNGSYCWVEGKVRALLPAERCVVEFKYVPPTEEALARMLEGRDGATLDDVLVDAAEVNLAQLRLL